MTGKDTDVRSWPDAFLASKLEAVGSFSTVLLDIDDFHALVPGDRDSPEKLALLDTLLDHARKALRAGPADSYRHGRDSALVVFPGVSVPEACQRAFEALTAFRSERVEVQGQGPVQLTFTAAVAEAPTHGDTAPGLLRVLEETLYQAKADGKNRVALPRERRMILKSSYFAHGQLQRLERLAARLGLPEAELLRLALDELLRRYGE